MNTQTKWAVLTQHSSEVGNKVNPVILVKHHQGRKFTFRNSTLTCLRTIEALSWLSQLKAEPRIEFSNPNVFFFSQNKEYVLVQIHFCPFLCSCYGVQFNRSIVSFFSPLSFHTFFSILHAIKMIPELKEDGVKIIVTV